MLAWIMLDGKQGLWVVPLFVLCTIAPPVLAYNTAGTMLHVDPAAFNHAGLTSLTWATEISEYEHRSDPFRYRIEFDSVGFSGSEGITYVSAMVQNVGHEFENDIVGSRDADPPSIVEFPALGIYFSSVRLAGGETWSTSPRKPERSAPIRTSV